MIISHIQCRLTYIIYLHIYAYSYITRLAIIDKSNFIYHNVTMLTLLIFNILHNYIKKVSIVSLITRGHSDMALLAPSVDKQQFSFFAVQTHLRGVI